MELWDKQNIFKIIFIASSPLSLDEWMEDSSFKGFARVCILVDVEKGICPGANIRVKGTICWQPFIYEESPYIYYYYGVMGRTKESCDCDKDRGTKQLYGV